MGRGGINRGWIASSSIPTRSLFPEAGRTIVLGFVAAIFLVISLVIFWGNLRLFLLG